MLRKLTVTALALFMLLASGCGSKDVVSEPEEVKSVESIVESEPEPVVYINPLTGEDDLEKGEDTRRPVAVMIGNCNDGRKVQTGVGKADIIYETEAEGGETRLMAVFQDVTDIDRIGSVRSARYAYIDLAMGHNAIYIHCGCDPTYAKPHLDDIDHIGDESDYGKRFKNGRPSWHTLYATKDKLWSSIEKKFKTENKSNDPWQSFASEDETVSLAGGVANSVKVPYSGASKSTFTYDSSTGLYTRIANGIKVNDYITGEATKVKNVIIMLTSITSYPDGEHRKIDLSSGEGYYITNGTYAPIKWSKGSSKSALKFTNADGSALEMNVGNTWVCIASASRSNPVFE